MRAIEPRRTPPHGAVPTGVIRMALDALEQQAATLDANGATRVAGLVTTIRKRLEASAREAAADLAWTSAPDAADRLGVSPPTIVRWISEGRLPGRKVGGTYLVMERGITAILEQR